MVVDAFLKQAHRPYAQTRFFQDLTHSGFGGRLSRLKAATWRGPTAIGSNRETPARESWMRRTVKSLIGRGRASGEK